MVVDIETNLHSEIPNGIPRYQGHKSNYSNSCVFNRTWVITSLLQWKTNWPGMYVVIYIQAKLKNLIHHEYKSFGVKLIILHREWDGGEMFFLIFHSICHILKYKKIKTVIGPCTSILASQHDLDKRWLCMISAFFFHFKRQVYVMFILTPMHHLKCLQW